MSRLFLLFLITPIVELFLLIQLGQWIGIGPTLALILVTAVIGSTMTRREGRGAWMRFQEATGAGRLPGVELVDGLIILISGALLLTPGVVTDIVGFLGLFPVSRALIRKQVSRQMKAAVKSGQINVQFNNVPGGNQQDPRERPQPGARPDTAPSEPAQRSGHYETTFGGRPRQRPSHDANPS